MRRALPILLLAALAGCTTDPPPRVWISLPPIPADIRAAPPATCRVRRALPPSPSARSTCSSPSSASEEAKSGCLARLIALYEAQAEIVREALK